MNLNADKLREEVFGCEHCADLNAFTRSGNGGRFFKFPPIIGPPAAADVLFIGINPRLSGTNVELHEWLMEAPDNFVMLSTNRLKSGEPYIANDGSEGHYHCHMIVIEGVFGAGTKFEAVAAVTELYLCASERGASLLDAGKSKCAERYLKRVVEVIEPKVVVAVGVKVQQQLTGCFGDIIRSPIVFMMHPAHLNGATEEEKRRRMQPTIDDLRNVFGQRGCYI